jgi:hypothetical protein
MSLSPRPRSAGASGCGRRSVSKVESGERRLDPVELTQFAAVYGKLLLWFLA